MAPDLKWIENRNLNGSEIFAFGDAAIFTLSSGEVLKSPNDRHVLDPTQTERDGVYETVANLVESRL